MKRHLKLIICYTLINLLQVDLSAQITLSSSTVNAYVTTICGPGITFSNATLTGSATAIAQFTNGISGGLGAGMNSGIVLSTGAVNTPTALNGPSSNFISTSIGTA